MRLGYAQVREIEMRILVVEDEAKTADYLRKGLSESGFMVADFGAP